MESERSLIPVFHVADLGGQDRPEGLLLEGPAIGLRYELLDGLLAGRLGVSRPYEAGGRLPV